MSPATAAYGFKEVLRDRRMARLSIAQFVSIFGDFLAIWGVLSIVGFKMHGNAEQVSGVLIAYMLPMAFVSPFAGVFVDRWKVKNTMIASDLVRGLLILFLLVSTEIWQIYAVLILLSAISSFFAPAQTIAIRSIVPKEGLMASNALMMQIMLVAQIITPSIAATLIKTVGENACFLLDSVTFFFSAAMVYSITIERAGETPKRAATIFHDLTSGVRFIFTHSTLAFTITSMAAGLFAIRCYSALIALYVRDILHLAQGWYGALGSMVGIGMVVGTTVVNKMAKTRSKSHMMVSGLAGVAVCVFILAVVSNVYIAAAATLGIGFSVALVVISAQTMMQGQTPMEMLGRVSSSLMSVLALAQVAGLALSGSIAQIVGIRNAYFATAALLLLIAAAGWRTVNQRQAAASAQA